MADQFSGGWDEIEIPESGGKFFKFPDGKVVKFVLVGKPLVTVAQFESGPKPRVRANIVDLEQPTVVQIAEFSAKMAQEIKALFEMSDGKQATIISCKRTGTGLQTKYVLVAGKALTDDQKAKLSKLDLHNLADDAQPAATADADEETPF